ncbi:MAG: hypothetical protein ACRDBY_14390 [Cetobacterium sp.]
MKFDLKVNNSKEVIVKELVELLPRYTEEEDLKVLVGMDVVVDKAEVEVTLYAYLENDWAYVEKVPFMTIGTIAKSYELGDKMSACVNLLEGYKKQLYTYLVCNLPNTIPVRYED